MNSNCQILNLDAWSDGQMKSKRWLCRELENAWSKCQLGLSTKELSLWIYGSWYGTLAQMLLLREIIPIKSIDFFDIDSNALEISKKMTEMWAINKEVDLKYHLRDCLDISKSEIETSKPDIVINTSCEHFQNYQWFTNLPQGQNFLIQSTNMAHPTHILKPKSIDDLNEKLGILSDVYFSGASSFEYPNFSFDRFMIIGKK